jgi:hypothetical protein
MLEDCLILYKSAASIFMVLYMLEAERSLEALEMAVP